MLVLSRKLGEKIHIGDDITITIVDIERGKIRLGIDAPREIPVLRDELRPGRPGRLLASQPCNSSLEESWEGLAEAKAEWAKAYHQDEPAESKPYSLPPK